MKSYDLGCGHDFLYRRSAPPIPQDVVWCWRCDEYVTVPGSLEDRLLALKGLRYEKMSETAEETSV